VVSVSVYGSAKTMDTGIRNAIVIPITTPIFIILRIGIPNNALNEHERRY
jgi:hypothetical protein